MLTRSLGKTGIQTSVIGLGTWNIGGQWGPVSDDTAIATIHAALDAGVTLIDTADAYGEPSGRSEELIGRALAGRRAGVALATKVGNFARRQGHPLSYTHPMHVELCCDASLARMRVETIDLYQCHIGNLSDYGVFLDAFARLKQKGKIRFGGLSTNDVAAVRAFNREGACHVVQLDYSLLNRSPEQELLPYCREQRIGVLVRGPLAMGIATGKFRRDTVFTDSVRQGWNEGKRREKVLQDIARIDALKARLASPARSMTAAALQFVISHPAVSAAIPGARSPEQAIANAAAGSATLSGDELAIIDRG